MIKKIDHFVLTTANAEQCLAFYEQLGFTRIAKSNHDELFAGDFKINVHRVGNELTPHASFVQVGSVDLCFEISESIEEFVATLLKNGITAKLDVVERNGTFGIMKSIYLRDPEGNLLEFSSYQ